MAQRKKFSANNLLLAANLISIIGFVCQTISFALDEWLNLKLVSRSRNATINAKFGLWEITASYEAKDANGTATKNETTARLFHSPDTWTEGAPWVEDLQPNILIEHELHDSLVESEVLISLGMALGFFVCVILAVTKFAKQLERSIVAMSIFSLMMLAAACASISGGALYLNTTRKYCNALAILATINVDFCSVAAINIFAIFGGTVELIGVAILAVGILARQKVFIPKY